MSHIYDATDVLDRFLRYVQVPTTSSDSQADQVPSTPEQLVLARLLAKELSELGIADAEVTEHGYVVGHLPASAGADERPALGLIAHLDTTDVVSGEGVAPHIVHYEGGALVSGTGMNGPVQLEPEQYPQLTELVGEDLVVSDGSTLLGADDKAGIAEIMALVARLVTHPELPHPSLGICFCPDEEIGHGAALLDLERFGCAYAYTVDGGPIGELEWECFNACSVTACFDGHSTHPGDAKGAMVNAGNLFCRFHGLLPEHLRPEHTEGYEGFIHLLGVSATCEHATARYIVRDHDRTAFDSHVALMRAAAGFLNAELGCERVHLVIEEEYRNMAEVVANHPELIDAAKEAFLATGIEPRVIPIRGGTDGAQLSFRGLPCPNLSTGGYACHSVNEFIPVRSLERMVDVLTELVARFA